MARLRKGVCYRSLERPYTRKSKFSALSFVKMIPHIRISRFELGNPAKSFSYRFLVRTKKSLQLRQNALESARISANKVLEKQLGKDGYFMKLRVYPHHVLRENPLATGAGADRMSTGMAHSFGKAIGLSARVAEGQPVVQIDVDKEGLVWAKQAAERIARKLPCACHIEVLDLKTGREVAV